jgi:hypothetical protein
MFNDSCKPISDNFAFGVNVSVHVLILFTFLSVFFFMYISKVAGDAFKSEIDEIIESNLIDTLRKNDQSGQMKQTLLNNSASLKILEDMYNQPSPLVEEHNYFMKVVTYGTIIAMVLMTSVVIAVQYFSCGTCIPITGIILENAIIFGFIGVVEYMFFKNVASQFVPAPPSLMVKTAISAIKMQ